MRLSACLRIVLIGFLEGVSCSCPSQCTCDYHGRNDGTGSRYAPLLATKCLMILRKRTPTRQPYFESKLLARYQRREGLIYKSFNFFVLILVAHSIVFILSSLAFKSPSNYLRLSNTFCITQVSVALILTTCPFQEVKPLKWVWPAQLVHRKQAQEGGPFRRYLTCPDDLLPWFPISFWGLLMPTR